MIYNIDYTKLKDLLTSNYCNSEDNPNLNKVATIGINNYCNDDGIWNMEEVICLLVRKINELIDGHNKQEEDIKKIKEEIAELSRLVKLIIQFLKNMNLDIDLSGIYTKPQIDAMINQLKDSINSLWAEFNNYYTKTEIDEMLANLDNIDLSNYYTKEEIDALLKNTKKPMEVYQVYNEVVITKNNSYITKDKIYVNLQIKRIGSLVFTSNFLYKVCRIAYKPNSDYFNLVNGIAKATNSGNYTALCGGYIDEEGDIYINFDKYADELIITGICELLIPTTGSPEISDIPSIGDEPIFVEKTFEQILTELLNNYNYYTTDQNDFHHIIKNDNKNIRFIASGRHRNDGYTIDNLYGDYRGFEEVQRILSYSFPMEQVNYIMSRWTVESSVNWIRMIVGNKQVSWKNQGSINVSPHNDEGTTGATVQDNLTTIPE